MADGIFIFLISLVLILGFLSGMCFESEYHFIDRIRRK